jgi:hypothetical protein
VFSRTLGLAPADAERLRFALLSAAAHTDAMLDRQDDYGARYLLEFTMVGPGGVGVIRSHWIVRHGEDFPRLTSCHVR